MCGRFTTPSEDAIDEYFGLSVPDNFHQNFDAKPTHHLPVVRMGGYGEYKLNFMYWTLLPKSFKTKKEWRYSTFNANGEQLTDKPMYKGLLDHQRCIVPMAGFFEWPVDDAGQKHRMYIYPRTDKAFLVAGLWQHWAGDDGEEDMTFTIVTCMGNEFMKPLHNTGRNKHRMPVILSREQTDQWMSGSKEDALELVQSCADDWMGAHEVARNVGNHPDQLAAI